ncbi:MAG: hypothetical protein GY753_06860 [Gammaproteobacteria bacterium]|nr:hypothetical protein [Gammaproteobacteria bacterium]
MNRPSKVRLLGVDIPILPAPSEPEDSEEETFGLWDPNTMTISINTECSPVQERVTVLHELVHAIDDFLYLELSHQAVYALSQTLYQVMVDNPQLAGFIQGKMIPESPQDYRSPMVRRSRK